MDIPAGPNGLQTLPIILMQLFEDEKFDFSATAFGNPGYR